MCNLKFFSEAVFLLSSYN